MLEGIVQNGVVVFGPGPALPDGTHVRVEPVVPVPLHSESNGGSLDWLLELAGSADDLPTDMARNHDHYVHGTPKR